MAYLHSCLFCLILSSMGASVSAANDNADVSAASANERLGAGINLGNMLEAPSEGEWGARFEDDYPRLIAEKGFRHVRLPVRWSAHLADSAPYTVDQEFMSRVRHVVDQCLSNDLAVVLNVHHFTEMTAAPDTNLPRLKAIWTQVSDQFADASPLLYFELLNEPHDQLTSARWNDLFPELLAIVREKHPHRPVIVGGGAWNSHTEIHNLRLPADDQMLIATFHYYLPFKFTHQGASWTAPNMPPLGRRFPSDDTEMESMAQNFAAVRAWSVRVKRPVYVGEFGCYSKAEMADRLKWTRYVVSLTRKNGFSSAYWEFCSGFGVYDSQQQSWRNELLQTIEPGSGGVGN